MATKNCTTADCHLPNAKSRDLLQRAAMLFNAMLDNATALGHRSRGRMTQFVIDAYRKLAAFLAGDRRTLEVVS
jgi:hypothetical protein